MGYLETAVVAYLRIIYFPHDNHHPLFTPNTVVLITELGRELSTLIMLAGAGILTGETKPQRFAFFIYSFAIWDLFYYVFLKLLLDWPATILDWDLLFLLPVPWIGPVLAPCIASLFMILLAYVIVKKESSGPKPKFTREFWSLLITGNIIIVLTFINYSLPLVIQYLKGDAPNYVIQHIKEFIPKNYNWPMFVLGQLFVIASIIKMATQKAASNQSLVTVLLRPALYKIKSIIKK